MREVQTFVAHVYDSPPIWVALCLLPPTAQAPEHRFLTVDRLPRLLSYARFRNAGGWGVYITPSRLVPHPRHRRKESFQDRQTVIYLDCDQPQCLEQIRERYPYPTLVVRTSRGRHQVYWRLAHPVPMAEQEALMSALALDVGADRAATDVSRVLRLPGFWNRKPGRNNTVDIVFQRDETVSYQDLRDCVRSSSERPWPARISASTAEGGAGSRGPGNRQAISASERDWYEVHRRLSLGQSPEQIRAWLQVQRADKPDPAYYAQLTVSKALARRSPSLS